MQEQVGRVRRYYERNTAWMLRFGQGRGEAVIHRPVWMGEGISRREALHTVDRLIAEALLADGRPNRSIERILDLGCGAGGSALWLAARYPLHITGITLSPLQARTARNQALRRGLGERCSFQVADFTDLPRVEGISGAYAVESFSHGHDPAAFFSRLGGLLPAGSRLIVCDDFLTSARGAGMNQSQRWLSRFRQGWHLQSLMQADQLLRIASEHRFQLVELKNLTPFVRPTPPLLSRLQRLLGAALRITAWGSSMYGGSALQVCQSNGWTEYLFVVLEKT